MAEYFEALDSKSNGLTEEELEDFNRIVQDTLNGLIRCADKHNIDRDSLIQYFANMFTALAGISTFKHYSVPVTDGSSETTGMTRFQKIKQMTVEEIAAGLNLICDCRNDCSSCPFDGNCPPLGFHDVDGWKEWLEGEVDET